MSREMLKRLSVFCTRYAMNERTLHRYGSQSYLVFDQVSTWTKYPNLSAKEERIYICIASLYINGLAIFIYTCSDVEENTEILR